MLGWVLIAAMAVDGGTWTLAAVGDDDTAHYVATAEIGAGSGRRHVRADYAQPVGRARSSQSEIDVDCVAFRYRAVSDTDYAAPGLSGWLGSQVLQMSWKSPSPQSVMRVMMSAICGAAPDART